MLLAIAITVSFFAGYIRRSSKLYAAVQEQTWTAENDGGSMTWEALDDGRVRVAIEFRSPVVIDDIEIARRGIWVADAATLDDAVRIIGEARAIGEKNGRAPS